MKTDLNLFLKHRVDSDEQQGEEKKKKKKLVAGRKAFRERPTETRTEERDVCGQLMLLSTAYNRVKPNYAFLPVKELTKGNI